jgi:stage III sporulation protein AC
MLDISLLFKIGALSILIIILDKVLKTAGKSELAVMTDLAGIVIILMMVVNLISKLFETVKTMFTF